ncbi:MAG: PVC-type heme-binding CxxCH protein [Verrucomicrobiota bacterium]
MRTLGFTLFILSALAFWHQHSAAKPQPEETTRILFLAGDRSHASGEHEFNAGCQLLAKALNEQSKLNVEATVISGWPEDESVFDDVDAVIIYSDGTKVIGQGWEKADQLAKDGVGLMFMHYAVHPSPEQGEQYFRPWIGGAMETGWSVNPHWVADLKALPDHAVSNGVTDLVRAYDEFYYNMRFVEDRDKVLNLVTATPTKDRLKRVINLWNQNGIDGLGKPQTLMWGFERENGGRGVGFTGGHYHRNWAIDGFRKLVLNAIVWTAGMEVPESGVPSKPLTEDELNANLDTYDKPNPRIPLPNVAEFMKLPAATNVSMEDYEKARAAKKKKPKKPSAATPKSQPKTKEPKNQKTAAAEPLYLSPVMKSGDTERIGMFDVDLDGATDIYLAVSDEGNRSHDWANWLGPVVTYQDHSQAPLTQLEWQSAKSTGSTHKDLSYNGKGPLKVEGKTPKDSIGTHAPSLIHFKLPKPAARLTGKVALDDGGAIRGGKSTPAEVRFAIYTSPPADLSAPAKSAIADFFDPNSLDPQKVPVEAFELPDDLEMTVWATSPMLFNPTNMDTDAAGRIWVTEGVNYRKNAGRRPEGDRVVVLEDTTGDGKADSTHTFVQDPDLEAPLGIAVLDNKIIVSQPPSLVVYTDVDRDLHFDPKVDTREELLTGFNGRQHDHSLHAVVAGPDGKFYFNQGNTGAKFTDNDGLTWRIGGPYNGGGGTYYHDNIELGGQLSDDGRIYTGGFAVRMNPDGTGLTVIGHGFRNSYEHCVTSLGDVFQNDNDDPPACRTTWLMEGGFLGFFSRDGKRTWRADMRPGQTIPEAEWRQDNPGTLPPGDVYGAGSPTGIAFYENGALPEKYNGLLLSAEARVQSIFGYYPEPDGAGYKLDRFDFVKATEGNMFRPSDVMVGADGAIYISDWFDPGVGGHNDRYKSTSGTIYRVAPKGFTPSIPKVERNDDDTLDLDDAITLLKSPSPNVRYTGFEALKESGRNLRFDVRPLLDDPNPYIRARAVWLLPFAGDAGLIPVTELLGSENPEDRLVAFRSLRNAGVDYLDDLTMTLLAEDESPAVRRELAVSLRDVPAKKKKEWVAKLFARMPENDRTYLEACGLAAEGAETAVWKNLHARLEKKNPLTWPDSFAKITWRLQTPAAIPALVKRATSEKLSPEQRNLALDSIAFTRAPEAAEAMAQLAATDNPAAKRWLLSRAWSEWKDFDVADKLVELGIYDPDNATIIEMMVPNPPGESSLPPAAEIAQLPGDATRGKVVAATCYACHEIDGQGVAYGPDLKGWVANQGVQPFIESILEPSNGIALGYEGASVKLKDGGFIHGLVYSNADPVIIQSMGGLTQILPADKVEKVANFKRSLMLSADQLGLTPQNLADLAAYLEAYQ